MTENEMRTANAEAEILDAKEPVEASEQIEETVVQEVEAGSEQEGRAEEELEEESERVEVVEQDEPEPAPKDPDELDYSYTQNRELSWLQFDRRVLEEALDPSVPLLERLKFISIFCTNLDEFFMVRVGSLTDLSIIAPDIRDNKTNMTPSQQLEAIFDAVKPLIKERDEIYAKVTGKLKKFGFKELDLDKLSKKERKFARDYYREFVRPVLSPQVVDDRHPFPHLRNKDLYVVTLLTEEDGSQHLGIVPVPDNVAPIIFDPENPLHFVRTEKLIAHFIEKIFDIYTTAIPSIISVTRNADISFDEEKFSDDEGDYRLHVSRLLKKRNRLNPVRLEIEGKPSKELVNGLVKRLKLSKNQVYVYDAPINLGWVFGLDSRVSPEEKAKLCYPRFVPRVSEEFDVRRSIIEQVEERDRLLFYPYDSIDPFLRMLSEAAVDPDVISIKITVYRLASESRVAQHLAEAAENGKEVTVLMELRARFDEANNIDWAARLEEAGCNIIYGMENYKCHSKVCLITKKKPGGITYITQIGTGNYNEKTARLYTDLSLITSDPIIGRDAAAFFQNMQIGNLKGDYEQLLVAPKYIKRTILKLIDREIAKGPAGRIVFKANSVTERDIIDKLVEASQAGVQVFMNIRGICCMLPGIEGKTDNIHVRSIVGQFLEHSRILVFGEGDDMEMFIGSADLMTRNLVHRVEVMTPVKDPRAQQAILLFLDKIFADNSKARTLEANGEYVKVFDSRDKKLCPSDERFCLHDWCIDHPLQGVERTEPLPAFAQAQVEEAQAVEAESAPEAAPASEEEQDVEVSATFEKPSADGPEPIAMVKVDMSEDGTLGVTTEEPKSADKGSKKDVSSGKKKDKAAEKAEKAAGKGKTAAEAVSESIAVEKRDAAQDGPVAEGKPSSISVESRGDVASAPVSTEGTEERLARERSYMSDFPHTTASSEASGKTQPEKRSDEHVPQHSAPRKKGFFGRLFS